MSIFHNLRARISFAMDPNLAGVVWDRAGNRFCYRQPDYESFTQLLNAVTADLRSDDDGKVEVYVRWITERKSIYEDVRYETINHEDESGV